MPATTPAEWLRLVAESAPALRAAGVTRLKLAGCEIEISPSEPAVVRIEREEPTYGDPLDDPATFGLSAGRLPGYPRRHREESDA